MLSEKEILENLEKGVFINPDTDEVIDSSDKQIDHDNNILLKFKIEFLKKYENIFKKRTYDDFFKHFLIISLNSRSKNKR